MAFNRSMSGLIIADLFSGTHGTHGTHPPEEVPAFSTQQCIPRSLVYGVTYGMGQVAEGPIAAVLAESSSPDAANVATLEMHSQRISMLPA
ncbi:hypothetical protein N431DRAFT_470230 [Stipitochalara longipes BDJ]|nr:hypothetical protein N431DRAFT_470230 [Stipitochalara longipes BDJ]